MKTQPPIRLALRRSRWAMALVIATSAATAALIVALPASGSARASALAIIAATAAVTWRRIAGLHAAAGVLLGPDRRITVVERSGRECQGGVLADSFLGRGLTTIVWCPDGARWPRSILVLPDALAADDFRRLRVTLRYGREAPSAASTSRVDAG